ncbi:MAG: ThiF family adenylyltransferase [Prevotellaceae bacterium]|jgi:adenylyltransferase/sulfurtransferase|nr:ThiF family adenylyltransferase [Prevotellaceae bacterium]
MKNNNNATCSDKTEWGKDVFDLLSWFKLDKTKNAKVLVVGAGALGNEVLKNLGLFGVGHIIIVDFDQIEYSNLTRSILFRPEDADKGYYKAEVAAKRLKEVNPTIEVQAICGDLSSGVGLGVYRRVDVVVGCLDSVWARILLNRQCFRMNKIFIDGGIGDLEGYATGYQLDVDCYECHLSEKEKMAAKTSKMSCSGVATINEKHGRLATTPVSASIIAAVQAQEAMKIIHKEELEAGKFTSIIGKIFKYNGAFFNSAFYNDASEYYDDCIFHEEWKDIVEIPYLSANTTVKDTLQILKSVLEVESVTIKLINDKFVDFLTSRNENKKFEVMMPVSKIRDHIESDEELEDLAWREGWIYQNEISEIDENFPYQDLSLHQIGIPYFDIIKVTHDKGISYIELNADKELYKTILNL